MKGTGACMKLLKARGHMGMYVHCHVKGKRIDLRASARQVTRARRAEWMTTFCSRRSRERRVTQLSGSSEDSRDQWVETLHMCSK